MSTSASFSIILSDSPRSVREGQTQQPEGSQEKAPLPPYPPASNSSSPKNEGGMMGGGDNGPQRKRQPFLVSCEKYKSKMRTNPGDREWGTTDTHPQGISRAASSSASAPPPTSSPDTNPCAHQSCHEDGDGRAGLPSFPHCQPQDGRGQAVVVGVKGMISNDQPGWRGHG